MIQTVWSYHYGVTYLYPVIQSCVSCPAIFHRIQLNERAHSNRF
ncbi:hypothetical protein VCHA56P521_130112 [Vibrio chagasii]|nr:hypothetical protein VCHA28FP16_100113 [Vibrio chagasii]CAH6799711.1 hypothetical protein VCHA35P150_100111 [Vibrio chagasii]CAH6821594.1 hypothetical protein VCHA36P168_130112 [Vibrio chagasii]CAH6836549.1 hypothetical protein VCHA30O60_10118 [Vibrio chagasii]CAH6854889.1 hypothetical protein VCHA31O73_200053 [Vibrio chagasii]